MRVKSIQLICRAPADRVAQHRFFRIQDLELFEHFFCFTQRTVRVQDNVTTNVASYGCDKLDDRLIRYSHRVFRDSSPENLRRLFLLVRKSAIITIDQQVCVNESGHECTSSIRMLGVHLPHV